ncbi:hypothetical protein PHYPSEUDO_014904 [Phytophthora pseudosyringae]|uniref:Uncharacterized protein n=1 Tax=Phytophthora pseudosyringae TaxID=221518 RepID=A0A8T1V3Q3_9STRA|nr:hypothetical protein PHYPSEUDO_014904 [Phytophthora pseudosyringae]
MKGCSLLVLLLVAIGAAAITPPSTDAGAIPTEPNGAHLRRLSEEEQPTTLEQMEAPEGAVAKSDENHAWWHHGGGDCYRGSRFWPRCKSYRHLEEGRLPTDVGEELAAEDSENHAPWHKGGGGCFPGSHLWPRCRGWGGRGDCFPGSRLWPRCKSF